MVITNLDEYLLPALDGAQEVWISVALVTQDGYERLQPLLAPLRQHYLIGTDLPTDPSVLRSILAQLPAGRIHARMPSFPGHHFHPKVYIVKKDDQLRAFVGSANLTGPGLHLNHEMSFTVTEQDQCQALLQWFDTLFDQSFPLNETNLAAYEAVYTPGDEGAGSGRPPRRRPAFTRPSPDDVYFDRIDLSGYFFARADYLAFRRAIQKDHSRAANHEREAVWGKFRGLHETIFPQFQSYHIEALDRHGRDANIVSLPYHAEGHTSRILDAMWLSYGKHRDDVRRYQDRYSLPGYNAADERDRFSFINHPRLQIRIEIRSLGIWLLFAKNDGSLHDRESFARKMRDDEYRKQFFDEVTRLPAPYWIRVNREHRFVSQFSNPDELHLFTRRDRPTEYFIIGRDYDITDSALLQTQLPITTLEEFRRLFPLYQLMRHYLEEV